MDVNEIRHRNLLYLVEKLRARGVIRNIDAAQALGGLGASYLSQLKGGKKLGEDTARKIERANYKPPGWMDRPQWDSATGGVADSTDDDLEDPIGRLMKLLPPDEQALLENYRAAGDAGRAVVEAAAAAAAKPMSKKGLKKPA